MYFTKLDQGNLDRDRESHIHEKNEKEPEVAKEIEEKVKLFCFTSRSLHLQLATIHK